MKKLILRFILFLIFLPYLYIIIFLLPYYHYIILNITILVFCILGTYEIQMLLSKAKIPHYTILSVILGSMMPVAAYIDSINFLSQKIFILYITTAVVIVFIRSLFINKQEEIAGLSTKISSTVLIIIYPGLFLSFFVFITGFNHASIALCFLCLLVIINDILAFFIGKLAGKKLNYIVSPNKSMAGYLAGITGSICVSLAFYYLFPDIFRINIIFMILFGAFIGITTIAGDLIESALKRAVGVKDSGTLMIGRGGILDSIDSLLLCAPVFYFIYPLIIQS